MNFTGSVIVGLLYVLPGILFVTGLTKLFSSREPSPFDGQLSIGLMLALPAAIAMHFAWLIVSSGISSWLATPEPSVSHALRLLLSDPRSSEATQALATVSSYWGYIATYFVSLCITSFCLGKLSNKLFKHRRKADWYDLLRHEADFLWLTTELEMGGVPYLFAGVLKDFRISTDGTLDRVVLCAAVRRTLKRPTAREMRKKDERYQPGGWVPIPGEFVVLDMKKAQTINVDYWYLEGDSSSDESSEPAKSTEGEAPELHEGEEVVR
jgi:hypothetical protein